MQAKTQKVISISIKSRERLKAKYQCSQASIYNALAYRTWNKRAEQIRQDAIKRYGGIEVEKPVFN